jgi:MFS family permease
VGILANTIFLRSAKAMNQQPLGWEKAGQGPQAGARQEAAGMTSEEAMKTGTFWILFLGVLFGSVIFNGFKGNIAAFMASENMSTMQSASYASLFSLLGAAIVLVGGVISEKFGNKTYLGSMFLTYIVGIAVLFFNPGLQNTALLLVTLVLCACATGIPTAMGPTITAEAFGNKDYTKIVGRWMTATYIGQGATPIYISGLLSSGSTFYTAYISFGAFAAIAFALLIIGMNTSPFARSKRSAGGAAPSSEAKS